MGIGIDSRRVRANYHLAGIVPVTSKCKDEFNLLYSPEFLLLAPNFVAIENAIITAAFAGCETIWIICDYSYIKIIKYIVGEYVRDYYSYYIFGQELRDLNKKRENIIPIFYVPTHPKYKHSKDGITWNVLYCAEVISQIIKKLSKWLIPNNYFVSFPNGVIPYTNFMFNSSRNKINKTNNTFVSYNNKTVRDGLYLPFTFSETERKGLKNKVKELTEEDVNFKIRPEYIWKKLKLENVFGFLEIKENTFVLDTPWYYNIANWNEYCKMLYEQKDVIKRPVTDLAPKECIIERGRSIEEIRKAKKR